MKTRTSHKPTIEQRVLDFARSGQLIAGDALLVVAVSGGPDSVCLLDVLYHLQATLGISLHVAHIDHGLRGMDSEADAEYVAALARRLGLPATVARRNVLAYRAEKRLTLEEASREVRYAFLAEVARQTGAGTVAAGHTLDDNVETILMHLVRGSGLRGLRGLQPLSILGTDAGKVTVVRPLLRISHEETVEYCRDHGLSPRLDASNLSRAPLRNRIRQDLLPLLESYNPAIRQALLRTAAMAADDLAFLSAELDRLWHRIIIIGPSAVALDKAELLKLPGALRRHALRRAIETVSGTLKDYEAGHIEDMMAMLGKPAGRRLELPGGLVFAVEYDRYLLAGSPDVLSPLPPLEGEHGVTIPGETRVGGWLARAEVMESRPALSPEPSHAFLDLDRTGETLVVRARHPGDTFQPLGMPAPVKLKDFMINARIPRAWRQRVPVFVAGGEVVWVGGWRIGERFKVTEDTRRVLHLAVEKVANDERPNRG